MVCRCIRLGPGDEVLFPTFTMSAVPNAIIDARGTPIAVDNAKDDLNPSVKKYRKFVTPRTKAIIVTHTYGIPA